MPCTTPANLLNLIPIKTQNEEYSLGHTDFEFVEIKPNRQHCNEQCPSSSDYHIQLARSLQMQAHCDINMISCRNTNPNPNRGVLSHHKDLELSKLNRTKSIKQSPLNLTLTQPVHSLNQSHTPT